jgi:hypothetical protein
LLAGVVDYAGLYPPAALDMPTAVAQYADHRCSADAWALGRFVVPNARLEEFEETYSRLEPELREQVWHLSAVTDLSAVALERVHAFNARCRGRVVIDSVEAKLIADAADEVSAVGRMGTMARALALFVEIPIVRDPDLLVQAIKRVGAQAKVRTGGVTAEMFPASRDLARFIRRCVEHDVAFKATAGLHHPLRARYALTYEPGAAQGDMFGFLNVLMASSLLRAGHIASDTEIAMLLDASDVKEFEFNDAGAAWRGRHVTNDQLHDARRTVALSFGSCSFQEPMQDLRSLALL